MTWRRLTSEWIASPTLCDFAIRYEDIELGQVDWRRVEAVLGVRLDEGKALERRIRGRLRPPRARVWERLVIRLITAKTWRAWQELVRKNAGRGGA